MLNVYTFNVVTISNQDKRERATLRHEQEGVCLVNAWDLAESKLGQKYPDHMLNMSVGNRQPVHLRPGYRDI